tara:strand:+ start:582 stop:1928 length:1347 start_codon:yes stop_codon:yes gene_type:complete
MLKNIRNIDYKIFKIDIDTLLIVSIIILTIALSPFLASIVISNKLLQFATLLICIFLIPQIILQPIRGLYYLPIFSYIVPESMHYNGISMGFSMSAITISSASIYVVTGKRKPNFSWLWILILLMLINMYVMSGGNNQWIKAYIQGITPFILFSFVIKTEFEARRVLKFWIGAYAVFAFLHILKGGVLFSEESILQGVASIRNNELGGHNVNVLGWLALLYLAITPGIALSTRSSTQKRRWWFLYVGIILLIIFSFSRAAMIGLVATFALLVIFIGRHYGKYLRFLLPTIITFLVLFIIWTLAVNQGIMDEKRIISVNTLTPAVSRRFSAVIGGWILIMQNPWGWGVGVEYSSHSGFTKAALEYGIIYFILFCTQYFYLIRTSYLVSKSHNDFSIKLISSCILAAGLVAVAQGIFGDTMFATGYIQVFWLLMGYIQLVKKDLKTSLKI